MIFLEADISRQIQEKLKLLILIFFGYHRTDPFTFLLVRTKKREESITAMPIVSSETKNSMHGIVNLTIIFSLLVAVGVYLWLLLPYWWLWLISMPIWGFGVIFAGHRIVPMLTHDCIEAVFKTRGARKGRR